MIILKESEDLKKQLSELQKDVIRLETRIQEMKEVQPKRTSSAKKDKTELN